MNRQSGTTEGFEIQSIATCQCQSQRFLGVEVLACAKGLAADRFVEVARHGRDHGVDLGTLQQAPGVLDSLGPAPLGLFHNALSTQPMLRFRIANPDDLYARQLEKGTQRRRASVANADQAQAHELGLGGGRLGFGNRPLREHRLAAAEQPRNRRRLSAMGGIVTELLEQATSRRLARSAGKA